MANSIFNSQKYLDKAGTQKLITKIGEMYSSLNLKLEALWNTTLGVEDSEYCVGSWDGTSDPIASEVMGDTSICFDWHPCLADTTDNSGTTTTPYWLMDANWLRYDDDENSFAPAVGITEDEYNECTSNDVYTYDEESDSYSLLYGAGEFDAEALWESDKVLILEDPTNSYPTTLYTYDEESGTYSEVSHVLRPWETTETKYTTGIAYKDTLYLLDNVLGDSGVYWKGIFKSPIVWDGIDVSAYPLVPTAVCPGPPCTVGSKTRNFFFDYYVGDTNCYGRSGYGSLITLFNGGSSYGNRTYPRSGDITQVTIMKYARSNNATTTNPYPFAEGGFHALNTFITCQEVGYGTKYLHSASFFGSGISSNDGCSSETAFLSYGGFRYRIHTDDDSNSWTYCSWGSTPQIRYNSSGSTANASYLANSYYAKEQVNESQIVLSYAVEVGIPADTQFEFMGGTYWWEEVSGSYASPMDSSNPQMNAIVYKLTDEQTITGWSYSDYTESETFDVQCCLRMSLIQGKSLAGDVYMYTGGGYEIVGTCETVPSTYTTGNPVSVYLQVDQTAWDYESTIYKTDLGIFDFESEYVLMAETTNLSDGYIMTRFPYTTYKSANGGGIGTYECAYGWTNGYNYSYSWCNTLDNRSRLGVRLRGHAVYSYCAPRSVNSAYLVSATAAATAGSGQFLIEV